MPDANWLMPKANWFLPDTNWFLTESTWFLSQAKWFSQEVNLFSLKTNRFLWDANWHSIKANCLLTKANLKNRFTKMKIFSSNRGKIYADVSSSLNRKSTVENRKLTNPKSEIRFLCGLYVLSDIKSKSVSIQISRTTTMAAQLSTKPSPSFSPQ